MTPKQIAREWLYLLGGLFFSQILVLILAQSHSNKESFIASFYTALFLPTERYHNPIDKIAAWVLTFSPYILFQFLRSMVWAFRTVFIKKKTNSESNSSDEIPLDWETNPQKYDDLPDDIWQKSLSVAHRAYKKDMPYMEWKEIMVSKLSKGVEPFLHRIWYNLRPRPTRR
jgi:hypothetical protein